MFNVNKSIILLYVAFAMQTIFGLNVSAKPDNFKSPVMLNKTLAVTYKTQQEQKQAQEVIKQWKKPQEPEDFKKVLRFCKIFSKLDPDDRLNVVNKLNPVELLDFYEALQALEAVTTELASNPKQNTLYKQATLLPVIDEYKNFKGSEILDALAYSARSRVAKIFNCSTIEGDNSLHNGTCTPLLNSTIADLSTEQRAVQPFKSKDLTPYYWVAILPTVDIFNRWFKAQPDQSELWKIYFLDVIKTIDTVTFWYTKYAYRIIVKDYSSSSAIETFYAFELGVNKHDFIPAHPQATQTFYVDTWYDFGSSRPPDPFEQALAESPDDAINILKNEIKKVYIMMLPNSIANELLADGKKFGDYHNYAIYIDTLINDPYVKRNISNFLAKMKTFSRQPKQIICPRNFIDASTKEETLANDAPSIFWQEQNDFKALDYNGLGQSVLNGLERIGASTRKLFGYGT